MMSKGIAIQEQFLTAQECEEIVSFCAPKIRPALVGPENNINNNVRRSSVFMLDNPLEHHHLFCKIYETVWKTNKDYFMFDVNKLNFIQFTEYHHSNKGTYEVHTDFWNGKDYDNREVSRKLSFTIQLSDPTQYSGGELVFPELSDDFSDHVRQQGTMTLFPSYEPHGVTPVETGVRHSLVGWVLGPHWR